jgi:uncharacterized phage protein gp47/JayE
MVGVPDLTPYVDLILDDRTADDLFADFLTTVAALAPEYNPLEGKPSVIFAQGICSVGEEIIVAVNRLPGAVLEALGVRGYALPRDVGAPATGQVEFLLNDHAGHVLPAGLRVAIVVDGVPVTFTTDVDAAVAAGNDTGVVAITADNVGAALNGIPVGTTVQVLDSVPFLDEMTLSVALAGGRDPEDSEPYLDRLAARLQRQTTVLTVASQFGPAALEVAGVGRALGIDRYDPGTAGVPPNRIGHVTLVLTDVAGAPVSAAVKAAVTAALAPAAQGGLSIHLADPTVTIVNVAATVHRDATLSDAAAAAACATAVQAYLSLASWPLDSSTVFRTEIEHALRDVPGITRVEELTTPAADVALGGVAGSGQLAQAGTIAITVVNP